MYTDVYIYFFFIIQRVKARAIPCHHQPPTRGDNTVSVTQGGTCHSWCNHVYICLYYTKYTYIKFINMPCLLNLRELIQNSNLENIVTYIIMIIT